MTRPPALRAMMPSAMQSPSLPLRKVHTQDIWQRMTDTPAEDKNQIPTDLVSQIQEGVSSLCELFYNVAGSLQRDAQLASVSGEPVDNSGRPQKADVQALGQQTVNASKALDALIARLPVLDKSEQQQLQEIADLMVLLCLENNGI